MELRLKIVALAALLVSCQSVAAQDKQSTAGGVFTDEQVKQGELAYQTQCAGCHGLDLKRVDAEAPDLTGGPFRYGWDGKTIAERFAKIRETMPKPNGRSLDDQTYVDIVAYILHFNGIPAGQQKLVPNPAFLETIVIAVPTAASGAARRRR